MTEVMISLKDIRAHGPCEDGWKKLLAHLGKTRTDDEPFPLETVLDSNGLADALWCLRCLGPEHQGWIRHYACDCADDVAHLLTDERSRDALRISRLFADGQATAKELAAAGEAAWAAAREAAADAAWAAAREAAADAAGEAAWAAAREAAGEAQAARLRAYLRAGGKP